LRGAEIGMGNKVTALSSEIDISGKQLIDLPTEKEVKDFVRLKSVNLNQNEFRRIPLIISAGLGTKPAICETLTSLDFSKNRLKALPEEFCNLVNLVRLKLDHNDLAELPLMFSALYKLEKLTLNFNRLKMLPPNIGALRGLKVRFLKPQPPFEQSNFVALVALPIVVCCSGMVVCIT
jgi:Leucine-rich repeat (LRR) protein